MVPVDLTFGRSEDPNALADHFGRSQAYTTDQPVQRSTGIGVKTGLHTAVRHHSIVLQKTICITGVGNFAPPPPPGRPPEPGAARAQAAGMGSDSLRPAPLAIIAAMVRLSFLPALALGLAFAQNPAQWTPDVSMRVQTVGSVIPSPDGKLVVYTQTRAVMEEEKSEMIAHIFLARADGSRRFQLTQGEKSCTSPHWSPDGRYIYFQSERTGKANLFRIPVEGGEAERLTDWKGPLGSFELSPDGKWIGFTGREEDKDREKEKKEKRDWSVVDDRPASHYLWVMPVEPDAAGKREPKKVFDANYHIGGLKWSPDSRRIAFEHQPMPKADYWTQGDISEVEVETGTVRPLAATSAAESEPRYSRDGKYVAFVRSTVPARWATETRIVLLPREGGEPKVLPATFDEQPNLMDWAADSRSILFGEFKGTRNQIFAMPVDGQPDTVFAPERGTIGAMNLNASGTVLGFAAETPSEPPEAYVKPLGSADPPRLVSRANADLPKLPLGETQLVRWKSRDGLEIEGLLTLPGDYEKGKKYPLILNIHGGPAGVFTQNFIGRPGIYALAAFSAKGYAILRANIRGSSGYGKKFRFANYNDWGGMDYQDLMAGVDHLIATGVSDPERLAVMGWSYGGYMTSWVITQTKRFKAAAVGAGVTNLWSFTGTADIPGFLPDYFSGEPWENFEAYRKHSPMSHVKGVSTPTLILHGESDDRVPISQGYELYNALRRQDVTTRMVTYPRMPHGPREPKFMLDIMQRHMDWVTKYVP